MKASALLGAGGANDALEVLWDDSSFDELVTLAKNSFTGSFLTPAEIAPHLAAIDAYAAA